MLIGAHQVDPSLWSEAIGRIAIVGDESSSMSDEALNVIAKETAAVIQEWNPQEVLVIRHTSEVVFTERLQQGQEPTPRKKRALWLIKPLLTRTRSYHRAYRHRPNRLRGPRLEHSSSNWPTQDPQHSHGKLFHSIGP